MTKFIPIQEINIPMERIPLTKTGIPRTFRYQFKPGDVVEWLVDQKRPGFVPFKATGTIINVATTTFGGKVKKMGATIKTNAAYQSRIKGRTSTVVATDKLRLIRPK